MNTADRTSVRGMVYAALFGALTAAGAFVMIPLPPVPITAQTFFLNVAALLLGGPLAALSQFIYVMLAVIGLPVFSGGKAGLGVIFGPTGGYLLGFIISAFIIGTISKSKKNPGALWNIFAMVIGLAVIYTLGCLQLSYVAKMSFHKALTIGVLPFIPGDIIKILLAALVYSRLEGRISL